MMLCSHFILLPSYNAPPFTKFPFFPADYSLEYLYIFIVQSGLQTLKYCKCPFPYEVRDLFVKMSTPDANYNQWARYKTSKV